MGQLGARPYVLLEHVVRAALEFNALSDIDARERELEEDYETRFWYLLAGHLKKTVGELQATMSVDEFKYWLAYSRRHPIGDDLADIHTAMICQAVVSTIPRKRGKKVPKIAAFVVDWWKARKQTPQQIQDSLHAFFTTLKNSFAKPAEIVEESDGGR